MFLVFTFSILLKTLLKAQIFGVHLISQFKKGEKRNVVMVGAGRGWGRKAGKESRAFSLVHGLARGNGGKS